MTGAAGHISHLYENLDLTFSDIKNVLTLASKGELESVTEKIDGINLMFSFDAQKGLRVARSTTEMKIGGLGSIDLSEKFADRGNVKAAFSTGFEMLEKAISVIPEHDILKIFGTKLNRWFSVEIVYSPLVNVINYDGNHLVFHESPVIEMNHGLIAKSANVNLGKSLGMYMHSMQTALTMKNWKVSAPVFIKMQAMSDGSVLTKHLSAIESAMTIANVNDSNTIRDYLYGMATFELESFGWQRKIVDAIANRIAKKPDAQNLIQLKKLVGSADRDRLDAFVKNENTMKKRWLQPIESAITSLSIDILGSLRSSFMGNHASEVKRLRDRLTKAIGAIQQSNDANAVNVLTTQMQRLGDVDNVSSSMEGIVFTYKGQTYKFCGAFAPLNQILALFKFGSMSSFDLDAGL